MKTYPAICLECGRKYGRIENILATWHTGTCDACGKHKKVTEPRTFWPPFRNGRQDYSKDESL